MLIKKVVAGFAIAALGVAAAYPHVNGYLKSLPQKMNKEQAGQRYLNAICPVNAINDQIHTVEKKLKGERSKWYYPGDALDNANVRVGSLENNLISLATRVRDAEVVSSRQLTNPKYIWPEGVQKDIDAVADEKFRRAGWMSETLKGRDPGKFKFVDNSNSVRLKLGLPPLGQGCPAVKSN